MSDDDVVLFEDAGIEEGHGKVPGWYKILLLILIPTFLIYLGDYLIGAQPSSAQIRPQGDAHTEAGDAGDDADEASDDEADAE